MLATCPEKSSLPQNFREYLPETIEYHVYMRNRLGFLRPGSGLRLDAQGTIRTKFWLRIRNGKSSMAGYVVTSAIDNLEKFLHS